jgi:peptide deformylase|tara:strand:- start:701 stop:1258 length:558 start_codon:yes stop_codon:yes gene_type:complete
MAILPILEIPHPILRKTAKRVRSVDKKMLRLAYDMIDTMHQAEGVGLAANQIGELWRIIVLQMPDEESARIYFNPKITKKEGCRQVEEGCLSIPHYRGIITRSITIKFQGKDHTDSIVRFKAENLLSQAVEHEVDHLNGILYPDHLVSHNELYRVDETNIDNAEQESIDDTDDFLNSPSSINISP